MAHGRAMVLVAAVFVGILVPEGGSMRPISLVDRRLTHGLKISGREMLGGNGFSVTTSFQTGVWSMFAEDGRPKNLWGAVA